MAHAALIRTLRIRTRRKFGNLGLLTTAFGDVGVGVTDIRTVNVGHNFTVRDFHLELEDKEHLQQLLDTIDQLVDSDVVEVINTVEEAHLGGKIRTQPYVDLTSMASLKNAYNPGVREIIERIDEKPELAYRFTAVQRTVAIVSDGSGLLGVGRVRSRAMLPVLEAKAALLANQAGLNSLPLVIDVTTEEEFTDTVKRIVPSCGAILLDAVGAARGIRVKAALDDALDVPLLDDDSDAPAISVLASLINACQRAGKDIRDCKVGQLGLGTAGSEIARLVMTYTGKPVYGEDVHPAALSRHVFRGGRESNLDEIMSECDAVVANTGHGDVIPAEKVRKGQVILALSTPRPEIDPYEATLAGAAFAADGQAINKVVSLPGVLLGAMGVKARTVNDEMRIAAAETLAKAADDEDILPTPFKEGIHAEVAAQVARAAVASGVAQTGLDVDLTPALFAAVIRDERLLPL